MRRRVSVLRSRFVGFRFAPDVITIAVRWYLRYGLSYRDVEELLAERGVEVDHVTVLRGFSSSHRCSSTRRGPAGTLRVIAGSSPKRPGAFPPRARSQGHQRSITVNPVLCRQPPAGQHFCWSRP